MTEYNENDAIQLAKKPLNQNHFKFQGISRYGNRRVLVLNPNDLRKERRDALPTNQVPISVVIHLGNKDIPGQVINYHYRGACLRVKDPNFISDIDTKLTLDFYLGTKCIKRDISFKIRWENLADDGTFGIEFVQQIREIIGRAARYPTLENHRPTVTAPDPTTSGRDLYFSAIDLSETGLRLRCSLSNRHLLPGMYLKNARLNFPNLGHIFVDLYITRTAPAADQLEFDIGVQVKSNEKKYKSNLSSYVSLLSPNLGKSFDRVKFLKSQGVLTKFLRKGLSYRSIQNHKEYEEVLKLRYLGYLAAGKVKHQKSFEDMGPGLYKEGMIIGAYLGSQLVASLEIRNAKHLGFTFEEHAEDHMSISREHSVEITRFVIHPDTQGSDILVGMFQRVHAILLAQGKPTLYLTATDKLKSFYKLLEAKEIGIRYPHPSLDGEFLNVLIYTPQVYEHGSGVNPFVWELICAQTTELFSTFGITRFQKRGFLQRVRSIASGAYLGVKRKFKKRRKSEKVSIARASLAKNPNDNELYSRQDSIDPRWTEQEISCRTILPYILVADEMVGTLKVNEILDELGMSREYLRSKRRWVSVAFMDAFVDHFGRFGSIRDLEYAAGKKSMAKDVLGLNYLFLKRLNAEQCLKLIASSVSRFNLTRSGKLLKFRRGYAEISIGVKDPSLTPKHSESCLNWIASFQAAGEFYDKSVEVKKSKCVYSGDEDCRYEILWKAKPISILNNLFGLFGFLLVGVVVPISFFSLGTSLNIESIIGITSLIVFGFILVGRHKFLKDYRQLQDDFDTHRAEADIQYSDLQSSLNLSKKQNSEMKFFEKMSIAIQEHDHLDDVLQTTLASVCGELGFSRAFIMLANKERTILETAAISETNTHAKSLWDFKIDISKPRQEEFVLSSCFHRGHSLLLNNVNDFTFQFNERSRKLISALGVNSFCAVAIPSKGRSWGVLIADKNKKGDFLLEHDQSLLERVARQLGLALDKHSAIEYERHMRVSIEKLVSKDTFLNVMDAANPNSINSTREVAALFLDLRESTKKVAKYSSEVFVEILNEVLGSSIEIIKAFGGEIDQFGGDANLAFWGKSASMDFDPNLPIAAAIEISDRVSEISRKVESRGLDSIQVGIGIAFGKATYAAIGHSDRLQLTLIGETVILAKRLETFTKTRKTPLIIEKNLYDKISDEMKELFVVTEEVVLSGFEHRKVSIAEYVSTAAKPSESGRKRAG